MKTATRAMLATLFLTALSVAPGIVRGVASQQREPFLDGPRGPYRGQVVELLTDKPLEDALVLVVWESDTGNDGGRDPFAYRELVTNTAGEFVVDATGIETALPPRTFPPRLLVYKPGYVTFPRQSSRFRFGAPTARFVRAGDVIPLKPAKDMEERAEALNTVAASLGGVPNLGPDNPFPESGRIMRAELEYLIRDMRDNPSNWGQK